MAYPEDRYSSSYKESDNKVSTVKAYVIARLSTIARQRNLLIADKDLYPKDVFEAELHTLAASREELITILAMLGETEVLDTMADECLI
jgi:hypothetical protein